MNGGKEVSIKLLQTWAGGEKVVIEKVASGLAVIIWDPLKKRCACTHFFARDEKKIEEKLKELISLLGVENSQISRLRAKIAGGSDVAGLQIGKKLTFILFDVIKKLGLPVGGYDIGGNITRTVIFDPITGKCVVNYLIGSSKEI